MRGERNQRVTPLPWTPLPLLINSRSKVTLRVKPIGGREPFDHGGVRGSHKYLLSAAMSPQDAQGGECGITCPGLFQAPARTSDGELRVRISRDSSQLLQASMLITKLDEWVSWLSTGGPAHFFIFYFFYVEESRQLFRWSHTRGSMAVSS